MGMCFGINLKVDQLGLHQPGQPIVPMRLTCALLFGHGRFETKSMPATGGKVLRSVGVTTKAAINGIRLLPAYEPPRRLVQRLRLHVQSESRCTA